MTRHLQRARLSETERMSRRLILLDGHIDEHTVEVLVEKARHLQQQDAAAPYALYINDVPGGHIGPTLELVTALMELSMPLHTHCLVTADGPAALLLAMGAVGQRTAASTAQLSFVRCDVQGNFETSFSRALAKATGQSVEDVISACRGHRSFTPDEARAYGLIDRVED